MKTDLIRQSFLDFFKAKKHKIIESDSLVPKDDPTVLFTPAGMNQFKKEFLGVNSGFTRAATSQRCLRTDDLDKVGKTPGHHTFFEMLGNFSFGDYFKKEAITWAWEFLTQELKINKEKLWVSVYKDDAEADKVWKDLIGVPAQKIIKLGDKENFWPSQAKTKGPNGPCGPCSEIFFDQGRNVGCKKPDCNPACDCGRFVEIWNLVFTQFNRKEGGILEPLPKKNIDTGMGLERLAAVMQGVQSNFETDLFQPIIQEMGSGLMASAIRRGGPANLYGGHGLGQKELIYAVVDHLRAIVFAIYDGVLPSNEERGYVVRKLIRRGALHLRTLGIKQTFLYKLVPVVSEVMQRPYPELKSRKENIAEIILAEEKGFISTLDSSSSLFEEKFANLFRKPDPEKAGKIAFQLYDTYGIPLELTRDWLDKQGIKISQEAFEQELKQQKDRSKFQSGMKGDVFGIKDLHSDIKETKFLGYQEDVVKAKVIRIIQDNQEVKIILDKTPFYAEAGGQVGDMGVISKGKSVFEVTDARRIGKVIVHIGKIKAGSFKKNDLVSAKIDIERRLSIARNHTTTHLLQAALRKVLGVHVQQKGSLVASDRLRFDFTHFEDIDKEQLGRIEEVVNGYVLNNYILEKKEMTLLKAKKSGALAFFGEKYDDKVRVVSISDVSKELCAGTHLESTGQIGSFKIVQEGSVAKGVRRIEAVTGSLAYKKIKEEEGVIAGIAFLLDVPAEKITPELEKRLARIKELEKQLNLQGVDIIKNSLDAIIQDAEKINEIKVITSKIENIGMDLLRKGVDLIKEKVDNTIIALGSTNHGKALLVMGITPDLAQKGLDATRLIKDVAGILGGSGGGRKDFAQAGGDKPENFDIAFQELKKIVKKL